MKRSGHCGPIYVVAFEGVAILGKELSGGRPQVGSRRTEGGKQSEEGKKQERAGGFPSLQVSSHRSFRGAERKAREDRGLWPEPLGLELRTLAAPGS